MKIIESRETPKHTYFKIGINRDIVKLKLHKEKYFWCCDWLTSSSNNMLDSITSLSQLGERLLHVSGKMNKNGMYTGIDFLRNVSAKFSTDNTKNPTVVKRRKREIRQSS